jgi:hypothetical protein
MKSKNAHQGEIPLQPAGESPDDGGPADLDFASADRSGDSEDRHPEKVWYVAGSGGQQQGPFDVAELQRQIADGQLRSAGLVWKEGMENWLPLSKTPGLEKLATQKPTKPAAASDEGSESGFVAFIRRVFSAPAFYRVSGLVFAGLAVIALVISAVLLVWGRSAFSEVVLLLLLAIVCEAIAAILDQLKRIEASLASRG